MANLRSDFPLEEYEMPTFRASLPDYYDGQDLLIVDLFGGNSILKQAVYRRYRDHLGSRFDYIGVDMLSHDEERLDNDRNLVTTVKKNLILDMSIPADDGTVDILHMHMPLLYPINDNPYNGKRFSYAKLASEVKRVLKGKFLMSFDNAFLMSIFQPKKMHDNIDEWLSHIELALVSAYYPTDGHYHHHLKRTHDIRPDDTLSSRTFTNEWDLPNIFLIFQAENKLKKN